MTRALLAEFASADALLAAGRTLRAEGYASLDAFTPYPVHGIDDALGIRRSRLPYVVVVMGLTAAATAYLAQWWMSVVDYPLDVGGRPNHTPLSFFPITFEMGVLFAALTAVIGVFAASRLPRLHHPVFEVPGFERATIDRFWLAVDADDPRFDRERTSKELTEAGAMSVVMVAE